jgi:AraC-like DNA-binding protein
MGLAPLLDPALDYEWSTESFPAPSALDCWMDKLSSTITPMQVAAHDPKSFRAHWQHFGLGRLDLNFLTAAPQRVLHTPGMISRRKADYDLLYLDSSAAALRHAGHSVRVPEGSFVLLDNQESYDLSFDRDSICLTTHIDASWLQRWVPHPKALVAVPVDGQHDWGAALAAMLRRIAQRGLADAVLPRDVIADQLGALLALMAGGSTEAPSRHKADLFAMLKRMLHERFDEADLDPSGVAQAIGISKRHLHGIFAQAGTTFGAVLMEIRLSRAAELLRDARFRSYHVGDVAWACGFADPSHFARRFRERFGTSPLDYRKSGRD